MSRAFCFCVLLYARYPAFFVVLRDVSDVEAIIDHTPMTYAYRPAFRRFWGFKIGKGDRDGEHHGAGRLFILFLCSGLFYLEVVVPPLLLQTARAVLVFVLTAPHRGQYVTVPYFSSVEVRSCCTTVHANTKTSRTRSSQEALLGPRSLVVV